MAALPRRRDLDRRDHGTAGRRRRAAVRRRRRPALRRGRRTSAAPCSAASSTRRAARCRSDLEQASRPRSKIWRSGRQCPPPLGGRRMLWTGRRGANGSAGSTSSTPAEGGRRIWSAFAAEVKRAGFHRRRCCSAWADPASGRKCWRETFGNRPGFPRCTCSTRPTRRRSARVESAVDLRDTLFIVSSKSGSTLEPNILKHYFFERAKAALGAAEAARISSPITDPGSSLQQMARARRLPPHLPRRADDRRPLFGAVGFRPGAGRGHGARRPGLPRRARRDGALLRRRACRRRESGRGPRRVLGVAARHGRDKVTIIASPGIADCRRLARAADRGIDRQGGQGPHSGRRRAARPPAVYGARPALRLSAAGRRSGRRQDAALAALEPRAIRSCASRCRDNDAARRRSSSAGRSRPRWRARSSASTRSTSPMSRQQGQDARADRRL